MRDNEHQEESIYDLVVSWLITISIGWNVGWIILFIYIHKTTSGITHWGSVSLASLEYMWLLGTGIMLLMLLIIFLIISIEPEDQ